MKGTATRWNEKGFGFIKPDDGDEDVFCHFSAITDGDSLQEGDSVEYEKVFDDKKGIHAVKTCLKFHGYATDT